MIYTTEEKQKIDALLAAFDDYIRSHYYFDIVYSEKVGYLRIVIENPEDDTVLRLEGYDQILQMLFDDMIGDRLEQQLEKTGCSDPMDVDYDSVRRQAGHFLQNLGEQRFYCLEKLEECIHSWLTKPRDL